MSPPKQRSRQFSSLHQSYLAQCVAISKCPFMPESFRWHFFEVKDFLKVKIEIPKVLAAIDHINIAMRRWLAEA